nr:HAMP domain-containing methyl-accepting chemotaxis protein [Bacillus dakarensis]
MKIKTKLILLASVLISGLVISAVLSVFQIKGTEKAFTNMQKDEEVQLVLKTLQYRFTGISNDERAFLLSGDPELIAGIQEKKEDISGYLAQLESMSHLDSEEREKINSIKESLSIYFEENIKVVDTYESGDHELAFTMHMEEQRGIRKEQVDPSINQFIQDMTKKIDDKKLLLDNQQKVQNTVFLIVNLVVMAGGIVLAILTVRSINKPLKIMNRRLQEIAEGEGDLTQNIRVDSKDELGEMAASFNKMIGKLRELIIQVTHNAEQVAAASEQLTASSEETTRATEQIAATVQEVAVGTNKQVQSVNDTKETVHDLSASVRQIAASSEVVSTTALQASEKAVEGNHAVTTVITQMNDINESVNELSRMVKTLGDRSGEISEIVNAITGIAGQTNLLALNAAIEAARAGEHGRGFAVVADEVRKLAEQSAGSAQEISQLISVIQQDTRQTVSTMEETTTKVAEGITSVHSTGASFDEIQKAVLEVTTQIQEVTSSVQEMSAGTDQMVENVDLITEISSVTAAGTQTMSAATEEQLAAMEEMTASSSSLSRMAEELQEMIRKFKV